MGPWIQLAAQMLAKEQQRQQAKRDQVMKMQAERAAMLGGNTMGIEAARFNRGLKEASYSSPQEIMSIYGQFGGKDTSYGQSPEADYASAGEQQTLRKLGKPAFDTADYRKRYGLDDDLFR